MCELVTQIFDSFMEKGLWEPVSISPVVSMLVKDNESSDLEPKALRQAFSQLCNDLRACLLQMGFKKIVHLTGNDFTYNFHSLRGNDIVVTYLSNEPRNG